MSELKAITPQQIENKLLEALRCQSVKTVEKLRLPVGGRTVVLRLSVSANLRRWAVIILFGIMITRAPTGLEASLDNEKKLPAALLGFGVFAVSAAVSLMSFGDTPLVDVGTATDTSVLAVGFVGRFVVPFEAVGFILLAALVGGIAVARRDLTPLEEEQRRAV